MASTFQKKLYDAAPPYAIWIFALIILTALALSIIILIPQYNAMQEMEAQILHQESLLNRQKQLEPLFLAAKRIFEEPFSPTLPVSEPKPYDRRQIHKLSETFKQMMIRHSMVLIKSEMTIVRNTDGNELLSITLAMTGQLGDFRDCLVELVAMKSFSRIDRIKILAGPEAQKEFSTTIQIHISKV